MTNMTQKMYGAQGKVGNKVYYHVATLTSSEFFRSGIKKKNELFFCITLAYS